MSAINRAKDTLLRALEQLEKAEEDLGAEPERVDLCVVYSIGYDDQGDGAWHEVGGWASTSGPKWLHAAAVTLSPDIARRALDGERSGA